MKKVLSFVAVVAMVALAASVSFAGSPLRAVGVEAGYVSPDLNTIESTNTWVAGVFADFGMPATNLYINPFVNYWNWSQTMNSVDTSFRDVSIGANLKWTIPTASVRFQPFLAAGAGVHMLNAAQGTLDQGDTKFGFQGGAGFNIGVSQNTNVIASGWYNVVEDVNHWSVRGGLSWNL